MYVATGEVEISGGIDREVAPSLASLWPPEAPESRSTAHFSFRSWWPAAGDRARHAAPDFAGGLKIFSDAFLKLISMIVGPIVFCAVVHGIAGAGDLKKVNESASRR